MLEECIMRSSIIFLCRNDYWAVFLLRRMRRIMEIKISPITGPRCPEGSRKLRLPDYVTMAQDGGKVVSLTHRPHLPPGNTPGTHFC